MGHGSPPSGNVLPAHVLVVGTEGESILSAEKVVVVITNRLWVFPDVITQLGEGSGDDDHSGLDHTPNNECDDVDCLA